MSDETSARRTSPKGQEGAVVAWRKVGFWKRTAVIVVKPLMTVMARRDWRGMEHIPQEGPVIVVANHISHADPLVLAHYVWDAGRWPVFLAKSGLFKIPVLGRLLRAVEQTPVERGTVDAVKALEAAVTALKDGKCVLIYPEGTTTREPNLWPMKGKTGAARLWLATKAPVIPVVMWGPQRLFDPRTHKLRPLRTDVSVVAGPPLDLSRWEGATPTPTVLTEITDHIMLSLRDQLAPLRPGETPPPLWTPGRRAAQGSGAGAVEGDAGEAGV